MIQKYDSKAIITIPPYAPFTEKLLKHKIISGARLNTVMPLKDNLEFELKRMKNLCGGKDLWIDLKCRQIRISKSYFFNKPTKPIFVESNGEKYILDPSNPKIKGAVLAPPWTLLEIDHEIEVDTSKPVQCYFSDGIDSAILVKVDKNKLYMLDGPKRVVGSGESINIIHPSLKIKGFFTDRDKEYIEASKKNGIHTYMLSYVEKHSDIEEMLNLDEDAKILAKIESVKGLEYARNIYSNYDVKLKKQVHLMGARGDLFVEVKRPHDILKATREISNLDENAVIASRIFPGLRNSPYPSCSDISDVGHLLEIGYRTLMIGDDICFNEEAINSAVNLLEAIVNDYR